MSDPNPKKRYGDAKVPLQLVPPAAMIAIAQGLAEGAEKYSPWNWRDDKIETLTYIGAIYRHLAAYMEGEDVDPDSKHGKTHLAGAIASLAILIDAESVGSLIDNRPGRRSRGTLAALQQGAVGGYATPLSDKYRVDWVPGVDREWDKAIRQIDQGIPSCIDKGE